MIRDKHQRSQQQKTCLDTRDFFFSCEDSQPLGQVAWTDFRISSIRYIQGLPAQSTGHPGIALRRGWTTCLHRSLPIEMILQFFNRFASNFSKLLIYDMWSRNEFVFGSQTTKSSVFCKETRKLHWSFQPQNKNVCIWLFVFFLPKMVRFSSSFEEFLFTAFLWIPANILCFL